MTDASQNQKNLLDASTRVSLAAYLHDLGKLAERARLEVPEEVISSCSVPVTTKAVGKNLKVVYSKPSGQQK